MIRKVGNERESNWQFKHITDEPFKEVVIDPFWLPVIRHSICKLLGEEIRT